MRGWACGGIWGDDLGARRRRNAPRIEARAAPKQAAINNEERPKNRPRIVCIHGHWSWRNTRENCARRDAFRPRFEIRSASNQAANRKDVRWPTLLPWRPGEASNAGPVFHLIEPDQLSRAPTIAPRRHIAAS